MSDLSIPAIERRKTWSRAAKTRAAHGLRWIAHPMDVVPGPDFYAIGQALRRGQLVDDRVYDEIYPSDIRRASPVHWTPVEVAMNVARLLPLQPGETLLDVGAGVGKFCIIAAAVQPRVIVRGIEHRARLVDIANAAAAKIGVDVDVCVGSLDSVDPSGIDAVYLFNPFAENLAAADDWLDGSVQLGEERYRRDIASMKELLRAAKVGTRVVTYCGFGGTMPLGYEPLWQTSCGGRLELWRKKHLE